MRKDLVVFLCGDCARNLEELNPYVYSDGTAIPLNKIEVIKVDKSLCENNGVNINCNPRHQAPVSLVGESEKPWLVKVWETIYDREQGLAYDLDKFETFEDAQNAIKSNGFSKYWAAYEIILTVDEEEYPVYTCAKTMPLADEFLKVY